MKSYVNQFLLLCRCWNVTDDIKRAYKKLALQCHPDKVVYLYFTQSKFVKVLHFFCFTNGSSVTLKDL